jgi:YVTN family beta-propeller protein
MSASANDVVGAWDPEIYPWPLIPVHAVVTPDLRIMTYGTTETGKQTGYFTYDLWDINAGLASGHMTLDNVTATDIFCGSQLLVPSGGQIFLAGGDNWTGTATTNTGNNNTNTFDLATNVLSRGNNINRSRWYSTSTALLNGEILIQGGSGGADRPEVRALDGTFRLLSNANTSSFDFQYPRNFVAPDGRVFGYDSAGRMYYVTPTGTGAVASVGQLPAAYRANDASAAMFRPGRILQFGGASNGAVVIDINGGTPVITPTQSMSSQRRLVNAAILPNGKVLATGGSTTNNQLVGVNNSAEIWDPTTGTWTRGPDGQRARLYHSISLLLPDARVLVGGGGAPGPQTNLNVEIYNPPYLFDAAGARVEQPRLTSAPAELDIGETFFVDFENATDVSRVTMVKSGSVTHSFNMEQRFVELTFERAGSRLRVQAPTRAADAPPGFWMLFVIDGNGVPSHAKIIKINVAANWNPAVTPTLANPGNQTTTIGLAADLQLIASDPNNDELGYGASGLPPGVTIGAATGRISGMPTTTGHYNVVVATSDGLNTATQAFVWIVTDPAPLGVALAAVPVATQVGNAVNFVAGVSNAQNARFRWDFDDGDDASEWSTSPNASHTFTRAGIYFVTVMATDDRGTTVAQTYLQTVHLPLPANRPTASSNIAFEPRANANARVWVVNQDNDSVSVFDSATRAKLTEISVGSAPRSLAMAPNGRVWVINKKAASISIIDAGTLTVVQTIALPRASQPFGVAFSPIGTAAFVVLEASGKLLKLNPTTGATLSTLNIGQNPRHLSISADGAIVYVSRYVTPLLPGEATASVLTNAGGAHVLEIDSSTMTAIRMITLAHSDVADFESQGRGIPNYLGAAVISPDGSQAWVPSKQDNIARGMLRDGFNLNFQNTVRAVSSRIDLGSHAEDRAARIDHDNSSVASAAAFDKNGVYMFVALETSREVAVIDAHGKWEMFRFDVGRAPQGVVVSSDGLQLYVSNFMDRTIGVFDLAPLLNEGRMEVPALATLKAVATEKLAAQVLVGKQLFYDARDPRLARDRYMSCGSCHNDGGHDGRVWDLTGYGEGLRNTISLTGRAGISHGFLHWSANFDEVQDFEGQIRTLAGGTGLMSDAAFNTQTRSQPLGTPKSGASADLDALAAYVASLGTFATSPYRNTDGSLTSNGISGRTVFQNAGCGTCHGGTKFTTSGAPTLMNVGTLKAASGQRLGGALTGIDPPSLRDVWGTAPYLHDGSAASLDDAVRAHTNVSLSSADIAVLSDYLKQIGAEESTAPMPAANGLTGRYFTNATLSGTPVLLRSEAVNFNWATGSPGAGVAADNFSVRWTGEVRPTTTGSYRFRTRSDDGVRLWVNGVLMINNWTLHSATDNTTATIKLTANTRYSIKMEYYEQGGSAVATLQWLRPSTSTYQVIPANQLYGN